MSEWPQVLVAHAPNELTARRLVAQLRACEVAALAFCRLLERWGRGEAVPSTAGAREAALRRAADRVETALAGLDGPLARYLLELEADEAEGRSWYGGPSSAELVEWQPVLSRAGVSACPPRRRRVPRARRPRPGPAGAFRRSALRRHHGRILALGGPVRPARHAPRRDGRGPARHRRVALVALRRSTVVGSVNLDLVARVKRLPRPGETVTDATFERVRGGKGANQAVAAARLGAEVRLVCGVGRDVFADEALPQEPRLELAARGSTAPPASLSSSSMPTARTRSSSRRRERPPRVRRAGAERRRPLPARDPRQGCS